MLVSMRAMFCLQQRKSSLLLACIEILTFLFTNPHFILLIRDWCLVLLSTALLRLSLLTGAYAAPTSSDGTPLSRERMYEREPCGALFVMDGCTLLDFKISTATHCHYKVWKSQGCVSQKHCKPKLIVAPLVVSKSWGNCHFWVNYPFKHCDTSISALNGHSYGCS